MAGCGALWRAVATDWMPSNKPLLDSGILEAWRTAAWRPPELDDWMTRWLDEGMMRVGMRMLMNAGKDEDWKDV